MCVVRNIKYKQKYKNLFIDDVCHTSLYVCVCIGVRREERRRVKEEKVKKEVQKYFRRYEKYDIKDLF